MAKKVTLKQIAKIISGSSAPKEKFFSETGLPFIRAGHLEKLIDNKDIIDNLPKVSDENAEKLKLRKVEKGTILFAKSGMSATKNRVYKCTDDSYIVNHLAAVAPDQSIIESGYLQYFFEWFSPSKLIIDESYPSIRISDICNIEITLPSKDIQKKIVNTLDHIREMIIKRKAQIEALDQLTKSVFLEMFGDVRKNTKNFPITKLNDVISKISAGKSLSGNESSQYKVLKTSAVSFKVFKPNEVKDLPKDYVPPKNHLVNKGDVLVSRMNTSELVGAAGYVFDQIENVALPDRIWKLHYNEKVNPIYLWYYINHPSFRNKASDIATGTSGSMKNIAQKNYLNIDIILPPIEIQDQFGEILIKFEITKRQMNESLFEIEKTFNFIMQQAFKGELFTQEKLPSA